MADNNEEITQVTEELIEMYEDLARQGKLTEQEMSNLAKATVGTTKALGAFSKDMAVGMKNFAMSVGGGSTEINTMKTVVTATGNAIAGLLDAIPFVGGALSALAKAATEVANLAIERLAVSFNSFQELSKAGLIGAEGITGLRNAMITAQIPMEKFTTILKNASGDLMFFSGTAMRGSQDLTKVMTHMQGGQDMQLRRLGFSIEEIGETVVDFQKMNQLIGTQQMKTTQDVAAATVAYGKELDMVAKLTGMQRKEIQKNREAMMNDTRFSAWASQQEGKVRDEHLRATMDFVGSIKKLAPTMGQGIQDLFSSGGVATTDAGKRLIQQGMGPTVMKIRDMMMSGQIDQAQAQKMLFQDAFRNRDKFRDLNAIIGDFGAGIPFQEMLRLAKAAGASEADIKKMKEAQGKQSKGTDELTDQLIKTTKHLERAQTNIDAIATSAGLAATAVEFMAKTMSDLTFYIKTTILKMSEADARKEAEIEKRMMEAKQIGVTGYMKGKGEKAEFAVSDEEHNRLVKERAMTKARIAELESKKTLNEKEQAELKSMQALYKQQDARVRWVNQMANRGTATTETMMMDPYGEDTTVSVDKRYEDVLGSRNWVKWGLDRPKFDKIMKEGGYKGYMTGKQADMVNSVLSKYSDQFGGLDKVKGNPEAYGKMIQEIKNITKSGETASQYDVYQRERAKLAQNKQKFEADGKWTESEAKQFNEQLEALKRLEKLLQNQGIIFEQINEQQKKQTQLQQNHS